MFSDNKRFNKHSFDFMTTLLLNSQDMLDLYMYMYECYIYI